MKMILLLLSLVLINGVFADEVKVEINPIKPVAGEMFQAVFHIYSDADEEPVINFSPYRLEVVGKNNYGVKTSTTWINGKFSSSRELTIVYDLAANEPGMAGLRDINVQIGSTTMKHPAITVNILKEPEVAADVFVMAEVPKKTLFLGEGIVVRYYLYSKVSVSNLDIKKYPKLNNFLKRFLQEPERSERVTVDGQLYLRTQIYGAKLFPEKMGELRIDPLQLSATVITSRSGDPFGSFGLGRESRVKTVSSESIKVDVIPLPEDGKTSGFTGLVGKHDFELQLNNSRLIVNEPLEVKLTVAGGGALENMEAPTILKHQDLEEFESNGDLKIQNADQATKIFEYTFLPKANLNLPATTMTLTYFDPDTMKYVPVQLSVPEIVVAGSSQSVKKEFKKTEEKTKEKSSSIVSSAPDRLSGPVLDSMSSWKHFLKYINLTLSVLVILIGLAWIIKKEKLPSFSRSTIPSEFKKGEFDFGEFTRWLSPLIAKTGKTPLSLIKDSQLTETTKAYFINLLETNDSSQFSGHKNKFQFVYKTDSFKELDQFIQSVQNENTSKSS
jgi:hypothetical protein